MTDDQGEPWLVAKDVCEALDVYMRTHKGTVEIDGWKLKRSLDPDEYQILPPNSDRGKQMLVISEPGIYALIWKSRKPEVEEFKRWVRHEVLPAIRKKGGYMLAAPEETAEETMARALVIAQDALAKRDQRLRELAQQNTALTNQNQYLGGVVEEQKPKVEVYERTMATNVV